VRKDLREYLVEQVHKDPRVSKVLPELVLKVLRVLRVLMVRKDPRVSKVLPEQVHKEPREHKVQSLVKVQLPL
jgi:hypothetical protein